MLETSFSLTREAKKSIIFKEYFSHLLFHIPPSAPWLHSSPRILQTPSNHLCTYDVSIRNHCMVNQTTWQRSSTSAMRAFSSAYKIYGSINCLRRGGLLKNPPVRKVPSFLRTKQPTPTVTIFLENRLKRYFPGRKQNQTYPKNKTNNDFKQ